MSIIELSEKIEDVIRNSKNDFLTEIATVLKE